MIFYVATGAPNACGPGCSEWIAAEGAIEGGTAQRFRAFLARFRGPPPPIVLNSLGGRGNEAMALGRLLRQRGMSAAIGATVPNGCIPGDDAQCRKLKEAGKPLTAVLRSATNCTSGCAYALLGGKIRMVPPDARLGVHASGWRSDSDKGIPANVKRKSLAKHYVEIRSYLREMGVSPRLLDIAQQTPHETMRFLTRDEIQEFGIDKRDFVETQWIHRDSPVLAVWKLIMYGRGGTDRRFRTGFIRLTCAGPYRMRLVYFRSVADEETKSPAVVTLTIGSLLFGVPAAGSPMKNGADNTNQTFVPFSTHVSYDALREAEREGGIVLDDRDVSESVPRVTKISVDGLQDVLNSIRERCRRTFTWMHPVPLL